MTARRPMGADRVPDRHYWDEVAADVRDREAGTWRRHADQVNAALCRRWLPAVGLHRILKTDVFDEVAGPGLFPVLAGLTGQVHAIDPSGSMVAAARARHPSLSAIVADVRSVPFAAGSFDAVVSNSTLDHFEDAGSIAEGVRELHRVLVPGGRLVLTLDNAASPVVALRNALPFTWLSRTGLVPYYVGATLGPGRATELLEAAGFQVRQTTAVLHCPRVLAIPLARICDRFGGSSTVADGFVRLLRSFEKAEAWPSRFRTGHFVALLADKA